MKAAALVDLAVAVKLAGEHPASTRDLLAPDRFGIPAASSFAENEILAGARESVFADLKFPLRASVDNIEHSQVARRGEDAPGELDLSLAEELVFSRMGEQSG